MTPILVNKQGKPIVKKVSGGKIYTGEVINPVGTLTKIYFNGKKSASEWANFLKTITFDDDGYYFISIADIRDAGFYIEETDLEYDFYLFKCFSVIGGKDHEDYFAICPNGYEEWELGPGLYLLDTETEEITPITDIFEYTPKKVIVGAVSEIGQENNKFINFLSGNTPFIESGGGDSFKVLTK